MKDLNTISEDLFDKIRSRFADVTIGDEKGNVTNEPQQARFFDFDYKSEDRVLGSVSISISEDDGLVVIYSKDFITAEDETTQDNWYNFLRELRQFARKRLLNFNTRDINKSNLTKRDYKFLAKRPGDGTMNESKLYGTSTISYQKIGEARIMIKHTESINQESATGRTQKIGKIYIESPEGERFKYPYKHLSGARAMARHVAEGGNAYDDFGKHITGLSEEMSKLRKFKNYMGRSAVMAESLAGYMDIVKERIATVKKTIESLQKPTYYKEAFETFNPPVLEDVPSDVAENWIDELTIKQFNEELQDIFPYIYNLIKEGTKAVELGPEDLDESGLQYYTGVKKHGKEYMKKAAQAGREGASQEELGRLKDKYSKAEKKTKEEIELEAAFEATLGQFSDHVCEDCGNPSWTTLGMSEDEIEEAEKKGLYYYVNKRKKAGTSRSKNHPDAPSDQDWKDAAKTAKKESTEEETNEEKKKGSHGKVCWKGYRRGEGNSCHRVVRDDIEDAEEGNAYAHAVRKAKMDGKKKGDKVQGPDGDEITLEKDDKTPLGEFILSYYDRETGEFPKGETAVLTMVEKDYGEEFIEPAKAFIEQVNTLYDSYQMQAHPQQMETDSEYDRMRELAGLR